MTEMPFGPSFSLALAQANNPFGRTPNFEKQRVWTCPPSTSNHNHHPYVVQEITKGHQGDRHPGKNESLMVGNRGRCASNTLAAVQAAKGETA